MDVAQLKSDYAKKKKEIKERLNHFRIFFNEPYKWVYSDKSVSLQKTESRDNHRLFEELCFCIFTANTSAEMGAKAVDAVREVLVSGSKDEMTERLLGVYRFVNKRPEYIVHTRDFLQKEIGFELKKKILSFNDMNELRNFFALNKNVKGIGMKEASHFLRNIGFRGYAILDKHIINSLHEFGYLETNDKPKDFKEYIGMENVFKRFAEDMGIIPDELDLLLWSNKNGRILK